MDGPRKPIKNGSADITNFSLSTLIPRMNTHHICTTSPGTARLTLIKGVIDGFPYYQTGIPNAGMQVDAR
jgi:hypothetical protein